MSALLVFSGLLAFHSTALRQLAARATGSDENDILSELAAKQQALMAELAKIQLEQPAGLPVEDSVTASAPDAPGTATSAAPTGAPSSSAVSSLLVHLNTANQTALETLPDIGPSKAQAILEYRTAHGRFSSIDELDNVKGIGEATLAKLRPYLTLD